jgi:hypothetical protein
VAYTSQKLVNATALPSSNVSWVPGVRGNGQPLTALSDLSGMLDICDKQNLGFVLWYVFLLQSLFVEQRFLQVQ